MVDIADMTTILVIDDEDAVRGTVVLGLKKNQFKVLQAATRREGIQIARNEAPDLILCDLHMGEPNETSMFALLRKNPATAHVPFILMTGQPDENSQGDEVLVKPFTLPALLQAIRRQLRRQPKKRSAQEIRKSCNVQKEEDRQTVLPPLSPMSADGSGPPGLKPSTEQLEALLARVQSLRNEERTQVARAIHDDLTQTLTVVAIELSLLESSLNADPETIDPAECITGIRKLAGLVHTLIGSAQDITAQLRPKVLDEFGLVAALEWLTQQVEKKTGMRCELLVNGAEGVLDPALAEELYRLSEELLSNAARYAHATAVSIRVANRGGYLTMEINDNGKGIGDQSDAAASLCFLAMRERTKRLRGTFQVEGCREKGNHIRVRIPLNH